MAKSSKNTKNRQKTDEQTELRKKHLRNSIFIVFWSILDPLGDSRFVPGAAKKRQKRVPGVHFEKELQIFGDFFRSKKASIRYFGSRRAPDPIFVVFLMILNDFGRIFGKGVRNDVAPEVFLTPRARGEK